MTFPRGLSTMRSLRLLVQLQKRNYSPAVLLRARDANPAGVFEKSDFKVQDPYPLVGRGNAGPIEMDETLIPHTPIDRSHESTNTKRARLLWQSRKRGILETDLLLSTFAAKVLPQMDLAELELYDKLLDEPDWEIYYYATGKKTAPEQFRDTKLMELLKQHTANEEKQTRSMPSLKNMSANFRADEVTDTMRFGDKEHAEEGKPQEKPELKEKLKKEDEEPAVIAS